MAFESLADKLGEVFKKLKGKGKVSEADVQEACAWCAVPF